MFDRLMIFKKNTLTNLILFLRAEDDFESFEVAENIDPNDFAPSDLAENIDLIEEADDTMENCYIIKLENEDYTIGKIIEFNFYDKYFIQSKDLNYVSNLPTRKEAVLSIMLLLKAPISKLVRTLKCPNLKLVTILKEINKKKYPHSRFNPHVRPHRALHTKSTRTKQPTLPHLHRQRVVMDRDGS
mgnify:CR=1 FL=1